MFLSITVFVVFFVLAMRFVVKVDILNSNTMLKCDTKFVIRIETSKKNRTIFYTFYFFYIMAQKMEHLLEKDNM